MTSTRICTSDQDVVHMQVDVIVFMLLFRDPGGGLHSPPESSLLPNERPVAGARAVTGDGGLRPVPVTVTARRCV